MAAQFSFKRLGRLIHKHWVENLQFHIYATLALIGALGIILLIWVLSGGKYYQQSSLLNIFTIGLYICGAVFASTTFKMLQKKESGTYWLSIPASLLEKLLTAIFYNLIVFTLLYCLCFFLVGQLANAIVIARVKAHPSMYHYALIDWKTISEPFNIYKCFLYVFFGVQALYMLGSVYFKRFSFILTTFALALVVTLLICYLTYLGKSLPTNYHFNDGVVYYANYNVVETPSSVHYELPYFLEKTILLLMCFGWAPVFWWATYFRLKEKEI